MNPNCPKCGRMMMGGAPHGPWAVQYECHRCNYHQHDANQRPIERPPVPPSRVARDIPEDAQEDDR